MMRNDEDLKSEIWSEIEDAMTDASWYVSKQQSNLNTRFCEWPGKSPDGRKWKKYRGADVFPWEGASDTEVRLADMIITENVIKMKAAFWRAKMQPQLTSPVETADTEFAGKMSTVLKWMLFSQMEEELHTEIEFAAQWVEQHGAAVLGIDWHEETGVRLESASLSGLEEMLEAMKASGEDFLQLEDLLFALYGGDLARAAELAVELHPGLDEKAAKAAVRDLAQTGEAEFPVAYVRWSRPRWTALRVMSDVFFPASTADIQRASFVARREWLTVEELEEQGLIHGWDEEWIELAAEQKGQPSVDLLQGFRYRHGGEVSLEMSIEDTKELIEVWTVDRRKSDDRGVVGIWRSVLHPGVPFLPVEEEVLDYPLGMYPYVVLRRERIDRPILTSRGVPELVKTPQGEIKIQRDSRADLTSLKTLPPAEAPASMAKLNLKFGPGVINYSRSSGSLQFMKMPGFPQESVEIEAATRADVDQYFGRLSESVPQPKALLFDQDLADEWLLAMRVAMRQTMALMRHFMPEEEAMRVAGGDLGGPWKVAEEELQGQFDLKLTFDVRELDPEFAVAKMRLISEMVLPADTSGRIDRSEFTAWQMEVIDPHLAGRVVRDMGAVTQSEIEDEQVQLTKIVAGIEPPMKEEGQNPELRLQVLQGAIQANPQLMQRYEQDELFRKLVDARVQAFQFRMQQEENKQIGRVGARPVLGS